MAKPRAVPLPAIILATLLVQLATPGVAWADGESPPTEAQPAVEVVDEAAPALAEILEAAPPDTAVLSSNLLGLRSRSPRKTPPLRSSKAIRFGAPQHCLCAPPTSPR